MLKMKLLSRAGVMYMNHINLDKIIRKCCVVSIHYVVMATLCSRCGYYIFVLWFLSSFFLSSFIFLA